MYTQVDDKVVAGWCLDDVCNMIKGKSTTLRWGWVFSRTNADSQWNPVYNAFHRFFCCGNETIHR